MTNYNKTVDNEIVGTVGSTNAYSQLQKWLVNISASSIVRTCPTTFSTAASIYIPTHNVGTEILNENGHM